MQRSSESIGAIAAALAKAQIELTNPEKSLTGTISTESPRQEGRTFRYAPLSSGLEIVRKCLGKHEIATVQATSIDKEARLIRLTTTLAHASGEWLSSEWPVCSVTETTVPHRLGAALTYARRHALFTLVGITGDDDADAPSFKSSSPARGDKSAHIKPAPRLARTAECPRLPLSEDQSRACLDELFAELAALTSIEEVTAWAKRTIPTKNTLPGNGARSIEAAFREKLATISPATTQAPLEHELEKSSWPVSSENTKRRKRGDKSGAAKIDKSVLAFPEPRRIRDAEHLRFVARQPCLICGRSPSDAHHVRFAQLRALGRKVSDEFTVPICRTHHRELHRHGDEKVWWQSHNLNPLETAENLWRASHSSTVTSAF